MVRTMFMQRRKVLLNALRRYAEEIGADASRALAAARIDPTRRPETLQVSELSKLAEVFASR
jgi:16S rRNA A1518/A1519 N6-dimethyltransferase RsmA/KsgA/DIM1 with predicted DNA glycosylase/AP lyase activity